MTSAPAAEEVWRRRAVFVLVAAGVAVTGGLIAIAASDWNLRSWVVGYVDARDARTRLGSMPVDARASALSDLGPRRHPAFRRILLDYADGPSASADTQAAQQALMAHHPTSWPAQVGDEYRRIGALTRDPPVFCPEDGAWWDRGCPSYVAPGAVHRWNRFLQRHPEFVLADEAHIQRARAHHVERQPDRVLADLDAAIGSGDASTALLAEHLARSYTRAWMPEDALERAATRTWADDATGDAVAYARVWRLFRQLQITRAYEVGRSTPSGAVRRADEGVTQLLNLIEQEGLRGLESEWRDALERGDSAAADRALVDLAWRTTHAGILHLVGRAEHERPSFEPLRSPATLLGALDRIAREGRGPGIRADAQLVGAMGFHVAVVSACATAPSPATESWIAEALRRYRALLEAHPRTAHAAYAGEATVVLSAIEVHAPEGGSVRCEPSIDYEAPAFGPRSIP